VTEKEQTFEVRERRRFTGSPATDEGEVPEPGQNDSESPGEVADREPNSSEKPLPASESADGAREAEQPAKESGGDASEDARHSGESGEEGPMPEITAIGILHFATGALSQLAWQHLGLMPSPVTGKVEANLPEARLSIDALAALAPLMNPRMNDANRRDMQSLITNLRLNYVEQSKRQGSGSQQ